MEDGIKVFNQYIDFHIVQKLAMNMSSASLNAIKAFLRWLIALQLVILNFTVAHEIQLLEVKILRPVVGGSNNLARIMGYVNKVLYITTRAFCVLQEYNVQCLL